MILLGIFGRSLTNTHTQQIVYEKKEFKYLICFSRSIEIGYWSTNARTLAQHFSQDIFLPATLKIPSHFLVGSIIYSEWGGGRDGNGMRKKKHLARSIRVISHLFFYY